MPRRQLGRAGRTARREDEPQIRAQALDALDVKAVAIEPCTLIAGERGQRRRIRPEQQRCDVEDQLVDQLALEKCAGQPRPALHQELVDLECRQPRDHGAEIQLARPPPARAPPTGGGERQRRLRVASAARSETNTTAPSRENICESGAQDSVGSSTTRSGWRTQGP